MSFIIEQIWFRKFIFDIIVSCALCLGFGNDTPLGLLTTSLGTLIGLSENPIKKNDFNDHFLLSTNYNIPILKYVLDVKMCLSKLRGVFS